MEAESAGGKEWGELWDTSRDSYFGLRTFGGGGIKVIEVSGLSQSGFPLL
jgi:hypothetical protein